MQLAVVVGILLLASARGGTSVMWVAAHTGQTVKTHATQALSALVVVVVETDGARRLLLEENEV